MRSLSSSRTRLHVPPVVVLVAALVWGGGAASAASAAVPPDLASAVPAAIQTAAKKTSKVSFAVSQSAVRKGERIWMAGSVTAGGKASSGRSVTIERRKDGSSTWKAYTTAKTRANGRFTVSVRPTGVYDYRARVAKTGAVGAAKSKARTVTFSSGKRTLAQRADVSPSRFGKPTSKVKTLSAAKTKASKVKNVTSVRYREYQRATLVEVRTKTSTRTWAVMGKIRTAYTKAGGPAGSYGVPVVDAKCGLIENGCVQRFSRGALYSSSTSGAATGAKVTGHEGEVIATARSQVGFKSRYDGKGVQRTKYNSWMGSTAAWCSFFQSWASAASGNGGRIPKVYPFTSFRSTTKKAMKTGSTPKVGALVFVNTYAPAGVATHVGLVTAVKSKTITVIDGNTTGNLGAGYRGILERDWPKSRALYYVYPDYS